MKLVTGSPAAVRQAVGSTCIHWRDSVRAKQGRSSMVLLWDVGRCNVEETGELCARDFCFSGFQWQCSEGTVPPCWERLPPDTSLFT